MRQSQLLHKEKLEKSVDIDLKGLEAIADAHAFEIWGGQFAHGEPFPVFDAAGNVRAYVFPYALGLETFPTDVSRASLALNPDQPFGAIYVSTQQTRYPVLRVMHRLHPLFKQGEEAEMIGRSVLAASDARLNQIYWLGLEQEYFEITADDRRLLLDVNTLRQVDPETALQPGTASMPEDEPQTVAWQALTLPTLTPLESDGRVLSSGLKVVPLAECVPAVNWTWWCVPTAWTMATCYYDNFIQGVGGPVGYGRLVGYWFEHPKSGHNVPDFIDQIVDPQTGNFREGFSGYSDFIQKTYGYSFQTRDVQATAENDWAWADITAEIDAGRPFVWGVPAHATCALGYRVSTNGKFVVVHTTWGDTPAAQRDEWLYMKGTGLTAIIPDGGTVGQNLALWSPDGGEAVLSHVSTEVRWYVWGDQIKTAEILISSDGGNTWTTIVQSAPCVPGWNSYNWTPQLVTDRARVRIRGYDANGTYIAGDGSQSNVQVLAGPRPVTLKTILVKATTDAKGSFSAPHGLERYTPDGYAIRAISVSVQHKNGNWHTLERSHDIDNRFWWNKNVVAGAVASPDFYEQPVQIVIFAEAIVG